MQISTRYSRASHRYAAALAAGLSALLAGCANGNIQSAQLSPAAGAKPALNGAVHGGQQPIAGSTVLLYAAATTGYSAINTNLLTKTVLTDANGGFNISGDYSCVAGQQLYLVALGGNAGSGTNTAAATMAALGDCKNLSSSFFISMNEVTTIGSAFALAPFMSGYNALGSTSSNVAGLAQAFASVNKLVNIGNGSSTGSALPAGATAPIARSKRSPTSSPPASTAQADMRATEPPAALSFRSPRLPAERLL